MELQGKVIAELPERSGKSEKGDWKVQEFVIQTDEKYPKKLLFEVWGADRLANFNIKMGDNILVKFDTDANENEGRWFGRNRAYDVKHV